MIFTEKKNYKTSPVGKFTLLPLKNSQIKIHMQIYLEEIRISSRSLRFHCRYLTDT